MAEMKKNYLTLEEKNEYEAELKDLIVNKRAEISQKIKEARELGDLSENAEYDAAKDEQRDVEARIAKLEKILANYEIIEDRRFHGSEYPEEPYLKRVTYRSCTHRRQRG